MEKIDFRHLNRQEIGEKVKKTISETGILVFAIQFLKETWYLFYANKFTVTAYLILYSIFNMIATTAIVAYIVNGTLLFNGERFISPDNIDNLLLSAGGVILIVIGLILICVIQLVQIGAVIHAYSMSIIGKKTSIRYMNNAGVHVAYRTFLPQNFPVIAFLLLLMPLTGFFNLSFATFEFSIPGFIGEFIEANNLYNSLYMALYVAVLLVEVLYIFSINYYLIGDTSFIRACSKSRKLIKGRYILTVICLFCITAVVFLTADGVSAMLVSWGLNLRALITGKSVDVTLLGSWTIALARFLRAVFGPAVNLAALTALFIRYTEDDQDLSMLSRDAFNDRKLNRAELGTVAIAFCVIILSGIVFAPDYTLTSGDLKRPEIVAHRGDSYNAPENTYPAFELAVAENADWAEMDVFMTKDGVVVVSHDDDLSRTVGEKVFIHDLTYDELMKYDVGKRFSEQYVGLRATTLDEVLKLCKDKIGVMIDIKYSEYSVGIEEKILEIVNANGMRDQVMVLGQTDTPLINLNRIDPEIETTYSMFIAAGHIEDAEFSDHFAIEEGNITQTLVDNVHAKGGKLYAWTINDPDSVQYLVDCGVDGFLSDNPMMIRKTLDNVNYTGGIRRLIRIYLNLLRKF